ncbi:L-rhamnose mutarotase [Chitinophagaceae bacterium LB-8]|uniref:L-rhamnose mutarotase n=1 Tax=Paraflavisolibacter caeni TaxID=2982496 RepID=A0A9X2XPZ1_9BACT|nr:L-rhamnose mutarotase [Paraflavisolibacter caeni]MCU7552553.1 L-rhamnose mutarotase [Paraflavisolibacter caeni]
MKLSWYNPLIAFTAISFLFASCSHNRSAGKADVQLTEKVFVVNILKNGQKLNEYLEHHQHVWPEVEAGFKKAGYKKITLYRYDHLLVMTIVVPAGADLGQMGKVAESYDKRCAEWNQLMNQYQVGVEGTSPGQTWVEAKPFYAFTNQ